MCLLPTVKICFSSLPHTFGSDLSSAQFLLVCSFALFQLSRRNFLSLQFDNTVYFCITFDHYLSKCSWCHVFFEDSSHTYVNHLTLSHSSADAGSIFPLAFSLKLNFKSFCLVLSLYSSLGFITSPREPIKAPFHLGCYILLNMSTTLIPHLWWNPAPVPSCKALLC